MASVESGIPESFSNEVRDAYAHLYDLAHLERHPLGHLVRYRSPEQSIGRRLRALLQDALEQIRPPADLAPSDRTWRPFRILQQRYIDGYSAQETMANLHISLRQMQRDHRKGLLAVTTILWRLASSVSHDQPDQAAGALQQEMDRLGLRLANIELAELVEGVLPSARMLAQSWNVRLEVAPTSRPISVHADPSLARPALLSLLSALITLAPHALQISWEATDTCVDLRLLTRPPLSAAAEERSHVLERLRSAAHLAQAQGGHIEIYERDGQPWDVHLFLQRSSGDSVLVVDDNEHVLQLFGRYLSSDGWRFTGVTSAAEARAVLESERPSLIVLDVMMRDVDGWQFLQQLRSDATLDSVPIIVCSVLDEPELARALGAQCLLKKPVTRQQMLAAVLQALAVYSRGEQPATAR
jgi:CheY-like chemotaxis protein